MKFYTVIGSVALAPAVVGAAEADRGSGRDGLRLPTVAKADEPSFSSSKSQKAEGSFLEFVSEELDQTATAICADASLEEICRQMTNLQLAGEKYRDLPVWYYLNYGTMTIAYPTVVFLSSDNEKMRTVFIDTLRLHRALGRGNVLRLQGYDEQAVNQAYWDHYSLLSIEDQDVQDASPVLGQYCQYVTKEYVQLKEFAAENLDTDFDSATFSVHAPIEQQAFYLFCMNPNKFASYVIRNDWEHHRAEVVGSLLNQSEYEEIVAHTIWHWESLFSTMFAREDHIPQLFKSFDVFLA